MYCLMWRRLRKRPPSTSAKENKRRRRVHRTLVAMALMYCTTWLPFFIYTIYVEIVPKGHNHYLTYGILRLIGATNAIFNPLLYGYLNSTFRKYYKKVYQKMPWYTTSNPPDLSLKVIYRVNEQSVKIGQSNFVPGLQQNEAIILNPLGDSPDQNCHLHWERTQSLKYHCPIKKRRIFTYTKSMSLKSI